MKFDMLVHALMEEYLQARYSTQDMKNIKQKVFDICIKHGHDFYNGEAFTEMYNLLKPLKKESYDMLLKFHQDELMIAKLDTHHYDDSQSKVKLYLQNEIRKSFVWLKEFLQAVILTRIGSGFFEQKYNSDRIMTYTQIVFNLDQVYKYCENMLATRQAKKYKNIGKVPWLSLWHGYMLLEQADSLSSKIQAVSLALNACHDNGRVLDEWIQLHTEEQLSALSNINERLVEQMLKKLIDRFNRKKFEQI